MALPAFTFVLVFIASPSFPRLSLHFYRATGYVPHAALPAFTFVLVFIAWSPFLDFLSPLLRDRLSAPRGVACFYVRLGPHRRSPFLDFLSPLLRDRLGAPHGAACLHVRLGLHCVSPSLRFPCSCAPCHPQQPSSRPKGRFPLLPSSWFSCRRSLSLD
jgi:hypothetical protein